MKKIRIVCFAATGLLSAFLLLDGVFLLFQYQEVLVSFESYGYPSYLAIPLSIAKVLAVIVIWNRRFNALKEWAYAGLFFDFLLAAGVHINAGSKEIFFPLIAMLLLFVSYRFQKKVSMFGLEKAN